MLAEGTFSRQVWTQLMAGEGIGTCMALSVGLARNGTVVCPIVGSVVWQY